MDMKKPKLVIAITGQARQGKDTLADIIQEELYKRYSSIYVEKFAFATALKKEVSRRLDISISLLDFLKNRKGVVLGGTSMRKRLENVGDYHRKQDKDCFAKLLLTDIEAMNFAIAGVDGIDNTVSIITDLRFKNEADFMWNKLDYDSNYRFLIVKLIGNRETIDSTHPSETEHKHIKSNVIIENTSTKEALRQQVMDLIMSRI